jgi:hypothetical protein
LQLPPATSGIIAATNQDVPLISITHTSVLSGSGAMRGLDRGFSIAVSAMRVPQTS